MQERQALFGVGLVANDDIDQGFGVGPNHGGVPANTGRCPLGITAVRRGHVLRHRGMVPVGGPAHVAGDSFALVENFDSAICNPRP